MKTHTPEYKKWLSSLRVGDTVCRFSSHLSFLNKTYDTLTIKRMTATQAVCDFRQHEVRFRLDDGKIIGQDYRYVEPITDATQKVNREAELRQWFAKINYGKGLPINVIEAMKAAYDNAIKETPAS